MTTPTAPARAGRRPTPASLLSWLMLVPCLVVFALFVIWPLGKSVSLSLHGSDLFGRPDAYVGLQHYRDLLGSAAADTGTSDRNWWPGTGTGGLGQEITCRHPPVPVVPHIPCRGARYLPASARHPQLRGLSTRGVGSLLVWQ